MCSISFMGKILSQVTKQNTSISFFSWHIYLILCDICSFLYKKSPHNLQFSSFQISLLQSKIKFKQKFRHQNILVHAWGDIKILLLEMKVQLGNVALNIWKWHFLTRLLLIKQGIMHRIRKLLNLILFIRWY